MTVSSVMWALPGPAAFVREISRLASSGRHVVAVLPARLTDDRDNTDDLANAIISRLDDGRRVYPAASDGSLVVSLGYQAAEGFGEPPTTLDELIKHDDVVGRAFVFAASDLDIGHLKELPRFLVRLEEVSRPVPPERRGTFVVIAGHSAVPEFAGKEASDLGLASLWFWNRIARWDVAAYLATVGVTTHGPSVLREVTTEAIIEVARWNLDHAHHLVTNWDGTEVDLKRFADSVTSTAAVEQPSGPVRERPPASMLRAWDAGAFEGWHDRPTLSPLAGESQRDSMSRHLWSAQARVILPWIEERRSQVEAVVLKKLGPDRMAAALERTQSDRREHEELRVPPEIRQLRAVIRTVFGKSEPRLRHTADELWTARNKLAHLEPLAPPTLKRLVETCAWLDL